MKNNLLTQLLYGSTFALSRNLPSNFLFFLCIACFTGFVVLVQLSLVSANMKMNLLSNFDLG